LAVYIIPSLFLCVKPVTAQKFLMNSRYRKKELRSQLYTYLLTPWSMSFLRS